MNKLTFWNEDYAPWRTSIDMFKDMDHLVEQFFTPVQREGLNLERSFIPPCDIQETENHFLLTLDVPGVPKKDINIELKGNELHVSGERKSEYKDKARVERTFGKFHRVLTLPDGFDGNKVEAQYQDGVLAIVVPKVEAVKPRQIKIDEGQGGFFNRLLGTKESVDVK